MDLNKTVQIEVLGPHPPCARCTTVFKNAEKAASAVKPEGIEASVKKLNIMSRETISKYGVLTSPALALNGTVKVMGRIPDAKEVEKLIREAGK